MSSPLPLFHPRSADNIWKALVKKDFTQELCPMLSGVVQRDAAGMGCFRGCRQHMQMGGIACRASGRRRDSTIDIARIALCPLAFDGGCVHYNLTGPRQRLKNAGW